MELILCTGVLSCCNRFGPLSSSQEEIATLQHTKTSYTILCFQIFVTRLGINGTDDEVSAYFWATFSQC